VISNGGTTITVTIRDNGRGDSDPAAGIMTDPAAPAVLAQVPTTTTTAPTTSPTTAPGALPPTGSSSTNNLIVLASLLVGVGCLLAGARRRQSKSAKA
jgi:LPXTG-motif cell wall-anchored protein